MDYSTAIGLFQESLYLIVVFAVLLGFAMKKGRQTITNIILGLYLALLISLEFPFYDVVLKAATSATHEFVLRLVIFAAFAGVSTMLFARIMPREYDESAFEGFGKKLLLAAGGTILVMTYSYHVVPVTEFITPGSPINYLFGSEQNFFYWLLTPIGILFLT